MKEFKNKKLKNPTVKDMINELQQLPEDALFLVCGQNNDVFINLNSFVINKEKVFCASVDTNFLCDEEEE